MASKADSLKDSPIFADLSAEELQKVAGKTKEKTFAEGSTIFTESMAGQSLFLVRSGSVKISLMLGEGDERTLAILGPGECFGELAVVDGGPRTASAVVVKKAEVLSLDKKDFQALCEANPKIGYKLMTNLTRVMVKRLRGAQDKLHAALESALKGAPQGATGGSLDVPIS